MTVYVWQDYFVEPHVVRTAEGTLDPEIWAAEEGVENYPQAIYFIAGERQIPPVDSDMYEQLRATLKMINEQLEIVRREWAHNWSTDNQIGSFLELKDGNGQYLAIPLLAAKSQCLDAMTRLSDE